MNAGVARWCSPRARWARDYSIRQDALEDARRDTMIGDVLGADRPFDPGDRSVLRDLQDYRELKTDSWILIGHRRRTLIVTEKRAVPQTDTLRSSARKGAW